MTRSPWFALFGCLAAGCGGDPTTGTEDPTPTDTGETPPTTDTDTTVVVSPDEPVELHFGPAAVEIDGKRYCLRTYNGQIPGPTLRIPAGTDRRVRIDLYNDFEKEDYREVSGMEGHEEASCHDFNLTNLHFHGGHVQPTYATVDADDPCTGAGCGPDQQYFGDHVLHEVPVGESAKYRWDLDEDGIHHEGTNWYHPHIHGSTGIQVINGIAGPLIVEGPLDAEPSVKATLERVLMVHELPYTHETVVPLADGEACTEKNLSVNNFLSITEGMPVLVNGKVLPRFETPPGQVERWRIVYAGTPDEIALKLHPTDDPTCATWDERELVDLVQYARDGLTMEHYFAGDTIWMSPGYRVDGFVPMPAETGTLCLVGRRTHDLQGTAIAAFDVTAEAGAATATEVPLESVVTAHAPPTRWTGTVDGVEQEVACDTVNKIHQRVGLLMPPTAASSPTQVSNGGSCLPSDHHGSTASDEVCECPSPNINCRRFEQRRALGYRSDRVGVVGNDEKWEIVAFDGHPFHIHINPFVVCENDSNKEPNFPHWRDTFWVQVEDGPREVLTHFRKFTGTTVAHCHKLNHEDEGMMELVELCAPDDLECQCQRFDGGQCVSQAGCRADDPQCQFAESVTWSYPLPPAPDPELCGPPGPL